MKIYTFLFLAMVCIFSSCKTTSNVSFATIKKRLAKNATTKNPKKMTDYILRIKTRLGEMDVVLFDSTPLHKENILKLASEGFYNGTLFHRVIRGFMIQGGDPLSKDPAQAARVGTGGPGYTIPAEQIATSKHPKGALAAARTGDMMNPKRASSGSQFYIVHDERTCSQLNGQYTVYGQVVKGLDVIDAIANTPTLPGDRPKEPISMDIEVIEMNKEEIEKTYNISFQAL